jgi:hypothetical protein
MGKLQTLACIAVTAHRIVIRSDATNPRITYSGPRGKQSEIFRGACPEQTQKGSTDSAIYEMSLT